MDRQTELMACAPLSLRYQSKQHASNMLESLSDLYKTETLCDIILNVGTCKIRAHKIILAAFSPYFRSMFGPSGDCQNRPEVTLSDIDEDAAKLLVDFCYTGMIIVDSQTVESLLTAVTIMQLREMEKLCMTFLTAQQAMSGELSPLKSSFQSYLQFNRSDKCSSFDSVPVESSGVFSPHTSPSVSASDQGATSVAESSDVDAMLLKSEPVDLSLESPTGQDSRNVERTENSVRHLTCSSTPVHTSHLQNLIQLPPPTLSISPHNPRPLDILVPHFTSPKLMSSIPHSSPNLALSPGAAFPSPVVGTICSVPSLASSSHDLSRKPQIQTEVSDSPTQCRICHQTCSCPETLQIHMELHEEVGATRKIHRKPGFRSLHKHQDMNMERSLPMCVTCGKCFKDLQSLKFHRYNHILRFSCTMCGKRFSRSWNLHRHKKTHYRPDTWPSYVKHEMKVEPVDREETVADTVGPDLHVHPRDSAIVSSNMGELGQINTSVAVSTLEPSPSDMSSSSLEPGQIDTSLPIQLSVYKPPTYTDPNEQYK